MLIFRNKQPFEVERKPLIKTCGGGSMKQDDYGDFEELTAPKASKKQHNPNSRETGQKIELLMATAENLKRKRLGGLVRKLNCANNKGEDDFEATIRNLNENSAEDQPKPVMIRISDHSTASPGGVQQLQTPFSNNKTMTEDVVSTWLGQPPQPASPKPLKKNSPKPPSKWETFTENYGGRKCVAFPAVGGCSGGKGDDGGGSHGNYDRGAVVIPTLAKPNRDEAVRRPKPNEKLARRKGFEQESLTDSYPSLIEEQASALTDLSSIDDTGSLTDHTDFTSEVSSSGNHFTYSKYLETGELPADTPLIMGVAQDLRLGAQMLLVGSAACLSIAATRATDCQDVPKRRK